MTVEDSDGRLTRRDTLRAVTGGSAATTALLATDSASAQEERPDFGGWLDGVDGGYQDARGEDQVTVAVGAEGNGGNFAFSPAGLWIDTGATVVWEWTGQGGLHNVANEDGEFVSELYEEAGQTFEHTFEESDIFEYVCEPHEGLDMQGAVAVGDDIPTVGAGDGGGALPLPIGSIGIAVAVLLLGATAIAMLANGGSDYLRSLQDRRARDEPISAHIVGIASALLGLVLILLILLRLLG